MSNLLKRTLICLAIAVCASGLLNAGGTKEQSSKAEMGSKFASVKPGEKVTMRFTHAGASEGEKVFMSNFKKHYEAKNPNITVDFIVLPGGEALQKIIVMTSAGDWPDLVGLLDVGDLAAMRIIEPLDEYFEKDKDIKKAHFIPEVLKYSEVNGKIYGVPITTIGFGLMVNLNLLKNTGYKLEDIKTWDDLLNVSKAMTKDGVFGYGFCGTTPRFMYRDFYISALSNGITMDRMDDPNNKNRIMELLAFYKKLLPTIIPNWASAEWADVHKYVIENRMGMLTTGTYYSSYMSGFSKACLEYIRPIAYPRGPSMNKSPAYVASYAYGITTGSKHKDVAWDMIREVHLSSVGPEFTGSIHTPANIFYDKNLVKESVKRYFAEHLDAQMDILARWQDIMKNAVPQPVVLGQVDIERSYQQRMFDYLTGKTTAEQFYEQWMTDLKKIKQDLVKKK